MDEDILKETLDKVKYETYGKDISCPTLSIRLEVVQVDGDGKEVFAKVEVVGGVVAEAS